MLNPLYSITRYWDTDIDIVIWANSLSYHGTIIYIYTHKTI
jgi:hypothetical protein